MEMKYDWLFPTTPLSTLLKARPLSMALFEKFRINPWKAMQCGLEKVCASSGIPWESFAKALSGLEIPDRNSDWKRLPIYHLLDFLSADHREFLCGFVPSIGRILSEDVARDTDSLMRLRILVSEWPAFVSTLAGHIREEEDVLFQRILRYDSILRLGAADPDFEGGSLRVFTAVRMIRHEHRDIILMRAFLDKVQPSYPGQAESSSLEAALHPLLNGFRSKLKNHAQLETEMLVPMARTLEKRIYDQFIRGGQGTLTQAD